MPPYWFASRHRTSARTTAGCTRRRPTTSLGDGLRLVAPAACVFSQRKPDTDPPLPGRFHAFNFLAPVRNVARRSAADIRAAERRGYVKPFAFCHFGSPPCVSPGSCRRSAAHDRRQPPSISIYADPPPAARPSGRGRQRGPRGVPRCTPVLRTLVKERRLALLPTPQASHLRQSRCNGTPPATSGPVTDRDVPILRRGHRHGGNRRVGGERLALPRGGSTSSRTTRKPGAASARTGRRQLRLPLARCDLRLAQDVLRKEYQQEPVALIGNSVDTVRFDARRA